MKLLSIVSIIFFVLGNVWASVEVKVSPINPIAGEAFEVLFTITTKSNTGEEPFISFDPSGVEIGGREKLRPTIETRFYNGKITTQRIYGYVYEMVSEKPKTVRLKNIRVEVGDEVFKHKNISIKIERTRPAPKDIFIQAEVSNESPYIGEAIDVKYYLYTSKPVHGNDIKEFPKLNGFIKRQKDMKAPLETVRLGNKVYRRALQYSARLYPEQTGKLKVDSMKFIVRYSKSNNNPFSAFGLSVGKLKEKTLGSKPVIVNVKELPAEGLPKEFRGLIGEHTVKLTINKTKFLVNEPIELRLEITGPGALEKFSAPEIFNVAELESFDVKSDFQEVSKEIAMKTFDYTFLARSNVTIPERIMKFYYFDPALNKYEFVEVTIPSITIGGGGAIAVTDRQAQASPLNSVEKSTTPNKVTPIKKMTAPLFSVNLFSFEVMNYKYIFWLGALLLLLFIFEYLLLRIRGQKVVHSSDAIIKRLRKAGVNYADLTRLLLLVPGESDDPKQVVKKVDIDGDSRKYFLNCLKELETRNFSSDTNETVKKIKFSKKAFRSLESAIKNENI